ncbi:MAG: 1-deoxy-D-xylulose-5-phosphate reductoisomerase [Gammaproteobacteria bacterium]|nr:MAG: 1-deoxy-D-xylulose-5-phosphate reductoisomerase [Gammaproteobacteria bacterium]
MKLVTILGATGSIGTNTLDVLRRHPSLYKVFALTAHRNFDLLFRQCVEFCPKFAVMSDPKAATLLRDLIKQQGCATEVLSGPESLAEVASHDQVDYVMAAIVGAAGLLPTFAAVRAGKRILLANKEALVISGDLFISAVKESGAELLPIDSEHNAIYQCLPTLNAGEMHRIDQQKSISKILLTASGGPFRTLPLDQLSSVTPQQAVAHPNWDMGRKISVDSATMMNKGLEIIEACWLFGTDVDQVQVVIHPQSVIHSMVSYSDGSVLAQMGNPDMRTPIAYGLAWPDRIESGVEPLDVFGLQLDFARPEKERFPCLYLAGEAFKQGGTASAVLNAANEEAVAAFLDEKIKFTDIASVIESTLSEVDSQKVESIENILAEDDKARHIAQRHIRVLAVL